MLYRTSRFIDMVLKKRETAKVYGPLHLVG